MSQAFKSASMATGLMFALTPSAASSDVRSGLGESYFSKAVSGSATLAELDALALEASEENWDGRGSPAVDHRTLKIAREFIKVIPPGFPEPELYADTDGEIRLEWFDDSEWTFGVSINSTGGVSYARRFLGSTQHGVVSFRGWWPSELQANLVRFASR